jgi:RNA polymerase sigma factor for flagellar operon FliA
LASAWTQFRQTNDDESRNALLEHYLSLVRYHTEWLHSRLPEEVELDDLVVAGVEGLRSAIEGFDPNRGVKFETYCGPRIRGSVLDALRRMDWVPRLVRNRARQLAEARTLLDHRLGRKARGHEVARFMGLSEQRYDALMRASQASRMLSLDREFAPAQDGAVDSGTHFPADRRAESPLDQKQREDLKQLVLVGLSESERMVLILYYYEEMTMKEVGATLGMSESRVSQIHSAVMERLQYKLSERKEEFLSM